MNNLKWFGVYRIWLERDLGFFFIVWFLEIFMDLKSIYRFCLYIFFYCIKLILIFFYIVFICVLKCKLNSY